MKTGAGVVRQGSVGGLPRVIADLVADREATSLWNRMGLSFRLNSEWHWCPRTDRAAERRRVDSGRVG